MSTWRRLVVSVSAMALALGAMAPSSLAQDGPAAGEVVPQGGEEVHSWALAPAGSTDPGEAGNRPNLSYEVDPGAELEDAVTLYNFSNVQLTFRVYATDAFNNEDGEFDVLPADQAPSDVGSWLTLPQPNVTVPPGAQITMPITVKVPADARPGDHAGAILASSEAAGTGADGKVVTLDRRTGTRVYLRVAGALQPDLAIESVDTSYRPALNPLDGTATVTYRIQNRGNVRLSGAHSASVAGPFGLARKRIPAEDLPELLPGEGVTLSATFDHVPAALIARTEVRLEPIGAGEALDAVTRTGTAFAPPITILLVAMAAWLALRARRAYRRHRRLPDDELEREDDHAEVREVQPA